MFIVFVVVVFLFTNDDVEGSMFIVVSKSLFWNKHRAQYSQTRHSGMDCRNLVAMDGNATTPIFCRFIGHTVVWISTSLCSGSRHSLLGRRFGCFLMLKHIVVRHNEKFASITMSYRHGLPCI